jgi:diguanylate cyclase (GGDEF)-like protein
MTAQTSIHDFVPAEGSDAPLARLQDENALLRAALIDARARLEELERVSERDPLTGLPNRAAFLRALDRVVAQANRHGTPGALLYVDIDALGAINEGHGQVAGDAAIIHVARQLQALIRGTDVAARVGDDEFALVLDHLDHDSAFETADRIARCIADNPLDLGGAGVAISATIGVATIMRGDTFEDVVRRGELTMRKAKVAG